MTPKAYVKQLQAIRDAAKGEYESLTQKGAQPIMRALRGGRKYDWDRPESKSDRERIFWMMVSHDLDWVVKKAAERESEIGLTEVQRKEKWRLAEIAKAEAELERVKRMNAPPSESSSHA